MKWGSFSIINKYLTHVEMDSFIEALSDQRRRLQNTKGVFIYGAGGSGLQLCEIFTNCSIPVVAFVDEFKDVCETYPDIPVLRLEQAVNECTDEHTVAVSLFSYLPNSDMLKVCGKLHDYGINNVLTYAELYHLFSADIGPNFWLTPFDYYLDKSEEVSAGRSLFQDADSLDLYDRLMAFRFSLDYSLLPDPDYANQYFPPDLVDVLQIDSFVSCGAFIGDTFDDLLRRGAHPSESYLFEPDLSNFTKLAQSCDDKKGMKISLFPCGLWDREAYLPFTDPTGVHSHVSDDPNPHTCVLCVSIDNVIRNKPVDFIKMDIEGAEKNALKGALSTIRKNKPTLAIAVYHEPADLWRIPVLINDILPEYDFYLRVHGANSFDVVLYAIPKD